VNVLMWCRDGKALGNHGCITDVCISSLLFHVRRCYVQCKVPLHHAQSQDCKLLLTYLLWSGISSVCLLLYYLSIIEGLRCLTVY